MDVETGAMASLLPKLRKLLSEKHSLQTSVRHDFQYLSQEMERMQAAVRKAALVPRYQLDQQVKHWAEEVRDLSYDMEALVDKFLPTSNLEGFKRLMEKMGSLCNKDKKTHHQLIASAIKDTKSRVKSVADRYEWYGVSDVLAEAARTIDPRVLALYKSHEYLVGIDGKRDQELLKLLSDGDNISNKKLKIVSVVGFGGLGKTTLVKAVYDRIKEDFDCRAFVPVGQDADTEKVFMDIIYGLTRDLYTLDERQLAEKLREILENNRYLIVIDDIWNESVWENIKYVFSHESNLGSRIITTTRIVSVSKACCSSANDSLYQMEPLSDDDSKKLLSDSTFGSMSGCPHEFDQVSSDILKKCGGLPLAIITVASTLTRGGQIKSKDQWHLLLKSIGRALIEDDSWEKMLRILSFSYDDLPLHQKTCLLYSSTFPLGHPIERDRLMKKWIAEGILTQQPKLTLPSSEEEAKQTQELSLEEAASQYLDELVNRNVIHPLECNNNDEVITYHIHPMMHEALKAIAIKEKFASSLDDKDISREHFMSFPHLSIDCQDSENLIDLSSMAFDGGVRSLTVFGHVNRFLLRHFQDIQSLDLEGCKVIERADLKYICSMILLKRLCLAKTQITELPPQIGNLQYLKGLDVGGTEITKIPSQIGNLLYLERLDVGGTQITELPSQIGKLQRLKTLDIGGTQITELPPQIGKLKHLKTLDVGGTQITKLPPQIGNLKYLEGLDVGRTQITELPPQIVKLQHLKTLDARKSRVQEIPDQVLQLTGLVHLLIGDNESSEGVKLPDGIGKMTPLQQLCTVDLRKCSASSMKELHELPRLKEIAVVASDEQKDTRINNALLSSLSKSTNLRSLVVYSDFRLSTLQSSSPYKCLNCRKKLTVLRSLKIPICIAGQSFLSMLDIRVCKLEEDDLKILRELPRLQSLIVRLEVLPKEMIHISCERFAKLESFYVDCRMPRVVFEEGAVPKLEHFELKLYGGSASEEHMGIRHLLSLQKVTLRYSKWHATNKGVRETTEAVKAECKEHQNEITLCIAEEDKDGQCIMKAEVFKENKDASCSRMTDIEEDDEHADGTGYFLNSHETQEGDLHRSIHGIASCSGTSEIEEVAE